MKKIEIKSLTEYFGNFLPVGKIQNRETRLAIVMLYGSLCKANKDIAEELESTRKALVGDKEEEIQKYAALIQKSLDTRLEEKEREKARKEAEKMEDCVKIDKDFSLAQQRIFNEDMDVQVKKVSLEMLYDALADCGFPRFGEDCPISVIQDAFAQVIE